MFRWLLERFAVKPLFNEDPYFKVQVDEDLDRGRARVTVTLIRSSATWRGKFAVNGRADFPLEIHVPKDYEQDGEYFVLNQSLSEENEVVIELRAAPLQTGAASVRFWFKRKAGAGGQIAVFGALVGQGDQEAIQKNRDYTTKHWRKWLEDNPDWSDTAPR